MVSTAAGRAALHGMAAVVAGGSMLQADISQPAALVRLLQSVLVAQAGAAGPARYLAVVLTKPPETVLVLLPVPPGTEADADMWPFLLFDSHARPASCRPGAHLIAHTTLEELGVTLAALWPAMMMEDVDPTQMLMYNTVEATVLAAVEADGGEKEEEEGVVAGARAEQTTPAAASAAAGPDYDASAAAASTSDGTDPLTLL